MPTKNQVYQIQEAPDKKRWYEVNLIPTPKGLEARCSCPEWLWEGKTCKHIERALSCQAYGL